MMATLDNEEVQNLGVPEEEGLPVQALCGGRTVEEAVEVLMVSSDEDEEPHQEQAPSLTTGPGKMPLEITNTFRLVRR